MQMQLWLGDCLDRMQELPENSVDWSIFDPPYDLVSGDGGKGFMGKTWDGTGIAFSDNLWETVYRVLRPGGAVAAFGGTRTFHRMAVAMERARFTDIGLTVWTYGSGFPKSLNLGKAFDKMHGAERGTKRMEYTGNALLRSGGQNTRPWMEEALKKGYHELPDDSAVSDDAKLWDGWGTALKPAWEPVLIGRKL